MVKKLRVFLPMLLLLAVSLPSAVYAATPTPLATETVQPTLTPYEPDIENCLPTSMIPTIPWDDMFTPTPATTLTPQATPTCEPGHICGHSEGGGLATGTPSPTPTPAHWQVTQITFTNVSYSTKTSQNDFYSVPVNGTFNEAFVSTRADAIISSGATGNLNLGVTFNIKNITASTRRVYVDFRWDSSPLLNFQSHDSETLSLVERYRELSSGVWVRYGAYADVAANGVLGMFVSTTPTGSLSNGQSVYTSVYIHVSDVLGYDDTYTPTPIATSTPRCGGATSGGEVVPSDPIATFNPPVVTSAGCYNIINPITVGLPSLSWSPFDMPSGIDIPGWQLCVNLMTMSASFAGVDFVAVLASIVTAICIGGIYVVLKNSSQS